MNGKDLPPDSREMEALIAYFKFVGNGTPEGVRIAGMGLKPITSPTEPPDARRGEIVYAKHCAAVTRRTVRASRAQPPAIGYTIPPLWGDASFNAGAGMAKTAYAASYIRDNMPFGINYLTPLLTVQQAWDVAAYHDFEAASGRDAGNLVRSGIRQRPRVLASGDARPPVMHCRGYAEALRDPVAVRRRRAV